MVGADRWLLLLPSVAVGIYIVVSSFAPLRFGVAMGVITALGLLVLLLLTRQVTRPVLGWTGALVALGVLGTLLGLHNGNAGARSTISIFIVEPLLLGLLFGGLHLVDPGLQGLRRSLDVALLAMGAVGFLVYLATLARVSLPAALVDPQYAVATWNDISLRTNYQGYNALVFLAPYGLARYTWAKSSERVTAATLASVALVSTYLSGRRVLFVAVPVVFVICLVLFRERGLMQRLVPRGKQLLVMTGFAIAVVGLVYGLNIPRSVDGAAAGQDSGGVPPIELSDPRAEQAVHLLQSWLSSPIIGHGSGAVLSGYVRDPHAPWSFEMSYFVVLHYFGAIGALVLGAWILWMLRWLWRGGRAGNVLARAALAGLLATLIGSAVDPYLFRLDGQWLVFAPFAVAVAAWYAASSKATPALGGNSS